MIILEEDFNDPDVRHKHYLQHVAQDWNEFYSSLEKDENGYIDPKFPPTMTESQYEQAANDLAMASAGLSSSMTDPIIGFKVKDKKLEKKGMKKSEKHQDLSTQIKNSKSI